MNFVSLSIGRGDLRTSRPPRLSARPLHAAKRILANSSLVIMVSVLVVIWGPARAEEGTPAQRRAGEPDVFRLCSELKFQLFS
jgi:hypothetical protein